MPETTAQNLARSICVVRGAKKQCGIGEACDLHQKYDDQDDDGEEDQVDPPEALAMPGAGPLLDRVAVGILLLRGPADLILLDLVHRRYGDGVDGLSIVVPADKQESSRSSTFPALVV